jgi:hypothetical protein
MRRDGLSDRRASFGSKCEHRLPTAMRTAFDIASVAMAFADACAATGQGPSVLLMNTLPRTLRLRSSHQNFLNRVGDRSV